MRGGMSLPQLGQAMGSAAAVTPLRPALVALAVAGAAFGLVLADRGYADASSLTGLLDLFVGWSFIGVGLYAWGRRPSNRIGPLMTATGFLWFVAFLGGSPDEAVFAFAGVFHALGYATMLHLLLAFPSGRLETRGARRAAVAGYVVIFGGNLLVLLVADPTTLFDCPQCPENVLQVVHSQALADVALWVTSMLAAALLGYVLLRLFVTWRNSHGWRRRALTPLLFSGIGTACMLSLVFLVFPASPTLADDLWVVGAAVFAAVPYSFLLGLARSATLGGGAVGALVGRLTNAHSTVEGRDALREALGDPSLELAFWQPESETYTDAEGRPIELPRSGGDRGCELVELHGRPVAAIVYDAMLVDDPQLIEAVSTAAALAIEKHLLDAELRAKLEELRASRERIVEAGFEERRRLERNLHDGAQQRFVSLALSLQTARSRLGSDSPEVAALLESAGRELELGLRELRDLARGIHPAILTDRGLPPALDALAARAPFEVDVETVLSGRLPVSVEVAAYFVVSEALANATKHAQATRATVTVRHERDTVVVEVADDGVGGASVTDGSGLRGLADRVAALDGRLEVDSDRGRGTVVRARIPCTAQRSGRA